MEYRLSEEAKLDLARIYWRGRQEYTEEQADRYYMAFMDHFVGLAEQPFRYQAVDHVRKGYRRSVCGVDSVYYRIVDNTIEVMRVIGRQDFNEPV